MSSREILQLCERGCVLRAQERVSGPVFISFDPLAADDARAVRRALEAAGLPAFMCSEDLAGDPEW